MYVFETTSAFFTQDLAKQSFDLPTLRYIYVYFGVNVTTTLSGVII